MIKFNATDSSSAQLRRQVTILSLGSPINWQIINGEDFVVCSVIMATENFDEGDILKKIEITDDKTVADFESATRFFRTNC